MWYGASDTVPSGYALCDGRTVAKSAGGGTVTTPDMRDRVPYGASSTHLTGTTFGQASRGISTELGGAHTHGGTTVAGGGTHAHTLTIDPTVLTAAQMPKHTHGNGVADDNIGPVRFPLGNKPIASGAIPIQDSATGSSNIQGITDEAGGSAGHTHTGATSGTDGAHSHTLTTDTAATHAHAVAFDVLQPALALHFIMKT